MSFDSPNNFLMPLTTPQFPHLTSQVSNLEYVTRSIVVVAYWIVHHLPVVLEFYMILCRPFLHPTITHTQPDPNYLNRISQRKVRDQFQMPEFLPCCWTCPIALREPSLDTLLIIGVPRCHNHRLNHDLHRYGTAIATGDVNRFALRRWTTLSHRVSLPCSLSLTRHWQRAFHQSALRLVVWKLRRPSVLWNDILRRSVSCRRVKT